jgi:hypothetical protein
MNNDVFRIMARCVRCGRSKNQHRAFTLECPKGKRTPRGYTAFATERFQAHQPSPKTTRAAPTGSPTTQ